WRRSLDHDPAAARARQQSRDPALRTLFHRFHAAPGAAAGVRDHGGGDLVAPAQIMSRTAWLNALLACAVAALAGSAYLKPRTGVAREYAVAPAATGEARSIRIERPDAAPIVLEKREGGWAMTAPLAARADELRVQRLLAIPGAKASSRLAATDLARFELDR